MKTEMYKFLFDKALTKAGSELPNYLQFAIAFKYPHYGAPKHLPLMDRPQFPGYKTYPHLSRPGFAPGMTAILLYPVRTLPVVASATTTIIAQKQLAEEKEYVPTGGQGSGFGASYRFFEALGINF